MQPKKLLMITGDGGIARGQQNVFYEMLKDFAPHFERVSIICPGNGLGKEIKIHDNVYLYPSPYSKKWHLDFWLHKKFVVKTGLELFKKNGFDLIDAHFIPPFLSQIRGGLKLSKLTGKPLVAEFMHLPGYPKMSGLNEWLDQKIAILFLKLYAKKLPHIRIINRGQIEKYFVERLHIAKEKLFFVSSIYLDFAIFKPLNKTRQPKLFVTAGRLARNKGLFLILEAISLVKIHHPDIHLKIVGDGELRQKLQNYIKKTGLENNVELLGWLPTQHDVANLYNQSQASIMASYNEGGPRVVFESMACQTPVLTTRVGETNEIIQDGINGIFIDWSAQDIADKILTLINHPAKLEAMREPAYKTVQAWEKKTILADYAKHLYEIMLK